MPKHTKRPGFRRHSWTTADGERRTAYYFEQTIEGKRKETPLGTDHAEALVKWHALKFDKPLKVGTLNEAFDRWEVDCLPGYLNKNTARNYKQSLRKLRPFFGPMRWDEIDVPMLAEYLKRRTGKTQANREKALLSVIWGEARKWRMTALPFPSYKMRLGNKEKPAKVKWTQAMFSAMYKHAEPFLRDAIDLLSATGWRITDAIECRVTDARDGWLMFDASKTDKDGDFDLSTSPVLRDLIARRKTIKAPHVFMLTRGNLQVSERMLTDAWARARKKAVAECPEVAPLMLRYLRKYAAQQTGSLDEAQQLLQHGSAATTQRHYMGAQKMRPVR